MPLCKWGVYIFIARYRMRKLMFLLLIVLSACSAPKQSGIINSDPAKPSILIAVMKGSDSSFKQELIALIKQDYEATHAVNVKVIRNYKDLAGEQYSALIVMDELKAWLWMNKGIKSIIKNRDKATAVYFISSGDKKWTWDRKDIKLVTSATSKEFSSAAVYAKIKGNLASIVK